MNALLGSMLENASGLRYQLSIKTNPSREDPEFLDLFLSNEGIRLSYQH